MYSGPLVHDYKKGCGCNMGQGMGRCTGGSSMYSACDKCRALNPLPPEMLDLLNILVEERRRG